MYTANRRQKRFQLFFKFMLFTLPFIVGIAALIWFVFLRSNGLSSENFARAGAQVAQVQVAMQDFSTPYYKLTLPVGWVDKGKQNPYVDQVYYEYQSSSKGDDNRWLHVYVDVFPKSFAINKLMPIQVVNNSIVPGTLSDDCTTFTGAPTASGARASSDTWSARWQGINFICAVTKPDNYVGTASEDEGYGVTLVSKNGTPHKYFFVYIDHNVRPDYSIFTNALKSFQTL